MFSLLNEQVVSLEITALNNVFFAMEATRFHAQLYQINVNWTVLQMSNP
jgi:hypothetical protein